MSQRSRYSRSNSTALDDWTDPRVEVTVNAVDWDALLRVACKHLEVQRATWGEQKSGGYNLVRFLHFDDSGQTSVVVRVPLHPEEGATREHMQAFCSRLESEVATMRYVEVHTSISVPHVIHYSTELDNNAVRSPYIIMSKVDGTPLSAVWDDMPDDKREIVLRQVVDILLELAWHRFDRIGSLFKREGEGKDAWCVKPLSFVTGPDEPQSARDVSHVTYSSGTDYWIAYANANLKNISENDFGSEVKVHDYAHAWFLRSLIPSLYDSSLDASGFPLLPGDFHSQNVMITDADSNPRVTSIIDWEFSSTTCTSSFAQYPLFIVDHPLWQDDHPLKPRNIRDQAIFNKFMLEAERRRDPTGGQPLSRAFANCQGVYLFEQCITNDMMFSALYQPLFEYIFGNDEEFSGNFYWALMENGILKKETRQFDEEVKVWQEAKSVLGEKILDEGLTSSEFIALAKEHRDRFDKGGKVLEWLQSVE